MKSHSKRTEPDKCRGITLAAVLSLLQPHENVFIMHRIRAYPQISICGKMATKGGGKNGEKELQVMDNIRCVLGGGKR